MHDDHAASAFVARWRGVSGSERANCQLFVTELCRLLGVEEPGPASDDTRDNAYVFERRVVFAHGDGSSSHGYIDCYRRGAFVLEAKKIRAGAHTRGFDDALLRARAQAEAYARALAEQIDAHRKARQAAHADVTLTGLYNVLARLRRDEPLSAKEKTLHAHGLVAVLRSLHDELDAAVLAAYGWSDLQPALADHRPGAAEARAAAVETLLERLVALNARRAAEEAAGTVRWLRPEFQCRAGADAPGTGPDDAQAVIELDEAPAPAAPLPPAAQRAWPASLPEQIKAVAEVLATAPGALSLADIESRFRARGRWRERLPVIVDTLAALGRARAQGEGRWRAA